MTDREILTELRAIYERGKFLKPTEAKALNEAITLFESSVACTEILKKHNRNVKGEVEGNSGTTA